MQTTMLIVRQIAIYYIMIAMGFAVVRSGILKSEESRAISTLMVYLVVPCTIINAFQIQASSDRLLGLGIAMLATFLIHMLFIVLLGVLQPFLHLNSVEKCSVIYSNAGNMIIPLVTAVFGGDWVFYSSAYVTVQLVFFWTHAKSVICGETKIDLKKILLNINMISVFVGLILFISGIALPGLVADTLGYMSNLLAPCGMLVIGMLAANADWGTIARNPRVYFITAGRMIIFPLVMLLFLKLCPLGSLVDNGYKILFITFLATTTPVASTVTQMSQVFGADAEYAAALNMASTVACLVTMPVMSMLYSMIWAV